jgi:hypothetical protein
MEISQGNSLCSYLYLKKAKIPCFAFYLSSFFFYTIREWEEGLATNGSGEVVGKEGRRVNMVKKMCTHEFKCKNDTC